MRPFKVYKSFTEYFGSLSAIFDPESFFNETLVLG